MEKLKVLNLYCGIGGNRKLWQDVDVTAVEIDPQIAAIYQNYFPDDKVIVEDAHQYLLDHFKEFDFIWSSPPCQTHTSIRVNFEFTPKFKDKYKYPDMSLYQQIIFLKQFCKNRYVVENVIPYYEPLIQGKKVGRHLYWSNFNIGLFITDADNIINNNDRGERYGFNLIDKKLIKRKDQILRNMVKPEIGNYILNCARNIITKSNVNQLDIFE